MARRNSRPWFGVLGPRKDRDSRGFGLAELLVVVAVIAILSTMSVPSFLRYWRSATLRAGAQELRTIVNQGRELALSQNTTVCVNRSGNKVQFLTGGCAGVVWTGPGTDGNGWFTLQNDVAVSAASANVVFNDLGAATIAGTYTVKNLVDNATMTVTVALSGRITIP